MAPLKAALSLVGALGLQTGFPLLFLCVPAPGDADTTPRTTPGEDRGCRRPQDCPRGGTGDASTSPRTIPRGGPGDATTSPRTIPRGGPGDANTSPRTRPREGQGMLTPPPGPPLGENRGCPGRPQDHPWGGTGCRRLPQSSGPGPSSNPSPVTRLPAHPAPDAVLVPECGGRSQGQYGALCPHPGPLAFTTS